MSARKKKKRITLTIEIGGSTVCGRALQRFLALGAGAYSEENSAKWERARNELGYALHRFALNKGWRP